MKGGNEANNVSGITQFAEGEQGTSVPGSKSHAKYAKF